MLRLPWKAWGETDVMLGMAADLHDRLICSCGCGQWSKDARDPDKKDRWQVDYETCFARRAITASVDETEPDRDQIPRVRLLPEGTSVAADAYADLLARFPHLRKSQDQPYKPPDHEGEEREHEEQP